MNPRRLTPSMSSLLAFEASARTESFTKAAQQLSLTQSAVSRQVQLLEQLLGVTLFQRAGRTVVLTDAGRLYFRELTGPLDGIRRATLQTIAYQAGGGTLHLAVLPTFGSKWLMPRLQSFCARHPEVLVHLHTRTYLDLAASGMDAAIVVGTGAWPDSDAYRLVDEELVPIVNPRHAAAAAIKRVEDLLEQPLLQVATRPTAWRDWLAKRGLVSEKLKPGPQFEQTSHLIQAVSTGMGVGLVPKILVDDELREGTLAVPLNIPADPSGNAYYLVVANNRSAYPPFVALRDWLSSTIRATF
ncbi:LysR substrate-binding domain-containing protein [Burkholderia cenocepacia]|uniref:LysR substrate-binding domain-containing protein n=1 Tax=Burkholderia cenocepacia TaxID=95486 RepID=UPI00384E1247